MSYEKFDIEQQQNITKYREKYFAQATSCEPAERRRAETAVRKMGKLSGIKTDKICWVNNPIEAASMSASLWESLSELLSESLSESLWDPLSASLCASLSASLSVPLWDSLWASLSDSLSDSLSVPLRDSLWDSLRDTGWLCFYSYCVEVLGIDADESTREKLRLHNEIAASCFAIWIMPSAAILCERPQSVNIVNKKLVNIQWRQK